MYFFRERDREIVRMRFIRGGATRAVDKGLAGVKVHARPTRRPKKEEGTIPRDHQYNTEAKIAHTKSMYEHNDIKVRNKYQTFAPIRLADDPCLGEAGYAVPRFHAIPLCWSRTREFAPSVSSLFSSRITHDRLAGPPSPSCCCCNASVQCFHPGRITRRLFTDRTFGGRG